MADWRTFLTCAGVLVSCIVVSGFNVDTSLPVIKKGPANSFFGYSVAQHQVLKKKNPDNPFDTELLDEVVGNYLLIGSPNLNIYPETKENYTGGVYKCNALSTRTDDCERLLQNVFEGASVRADKGRTNQWLGVVVRSGGRGGQVVTCAHRYKITDNNYGIGTCYKLSQALEFDQFLGIGTQLNPCQGLSMRNEHEEHAFCQAGTSAYITEESRLIMGAPGAINWRGLISEIDVSEGIGVIRQIMYSPSTNSDPVPPPVPLLSYLGYSVVGGKFDNTGHTYFVAGAPRSLNVGQVIFFSKMTSGRILKYDEPQILSGELPFSGFGQDLLAVDVNNDGFEDLIVGCPFYFQEEKNNLRIGGAIYVYIGNGDMITNFTKPQVIKGRTISQEDCNKLSCHHARFGFSLANTGDLNIDGFQDFAVGAPYEGKGAVYIYHGSSEGVKEPFSQRIYAEDVAGATGWETFGYSLSGGLDLDSNYYPDLLVGAYQSDSVAMLRTRPIIHLHSNVTLEPRSLNMSIGNKKECQFDGSLRFCIQLKICLRFTAEPADRFVGTPTIIYRIVAEPDRINPRVEFKFPTDPSGHVVENSFQLLPQTLSGLSSDETNPLCSSVTQIAYLKDQISDVLSSIQFGISYRLPERTTPIPTASPWALPDINEYPILDTGSSTEETTFIAEVDFVKKCGDNQICESNLQMDVQLDLKHDKQGVAVLQLGESDFLRVRVRVENKGEIAYQTAFFLKHPASLSWQSSEPKNIGCSPVNITMVECKDIGSKELGRPLKAGAEVDFILTFGTKEVTSEVTRLELKAWVNTTSLEQTPQGDMATIPIRVLVYADMEVVGRSSPDSSIQYTGTVRGESAIKDEYEIGPAINHTFIVTNLGNGTVESSELIISWPFELASKYTHGKHLLYLMQSPQVVSGDADCYDQPDLINVLNVEEDPALNIRPRQVRPYFGSGPSYDVSTDGSGRRRRREANPEPDTSKEGTVAKSSSDAPKIGEARERRNAVVLDCVKGTAKCVQFRCKIGKLKKKQYVEIKVRARLWESTLIEDFHDVEEVLIQSQGKLHIRPELNVNQPNKDNDVGFAVTSAIPSLKIAPKKEVEWWIILVAVLGGIILLVVVALLLWKCGFFKRQRLEDVNPTYNVKVEKKKDYPDETDYFLNKK